MNGLNRSPSKIAIPVGTKKVPVKRASNTHESMTSPTFDFSFDEPESDLSAEAQKIMQGVRQEAARIRAQMTEERDRQKQVENEADSLTGVGGRQIRKPKGKSGRFSDVHRAEFRKMDSIANHASTWKSKLQGATSASLKRSPSKADLDGTPTSLPRTKSFMSLYSKSSERLENTSPGKRVKRGAEDDVSDARPVSQDSNHFKAHSSQVLPSAITTPTKASLARSASVKNLKTSMIPTLTKSASTKTLRSPPKTYGSNKRLGSWSKFGGNMRSILSRAQPRSSNETTNMEDGTKPSPLKKGSDLEKALPSAPSTPTIKHVNFTPSTKARHEAALTAASPTPLKQRDEAAQIESSSSPGKGEDEVFYPNLVTSPNVTRRAKSPKGRSPVSTNGPENFTFRTENTIKFQAPSSAPKSAIPVSPVRTIRPVHPSGVPTTDAMSGVLIPAISHGISNKKRKHDASSDADDIENVDPERHVEDEVEPKAKKARLDTSFSPIKRTEPSPAKRRGTIGGGKSPKKGGISLGRLNMLARPKGRK